MTRSLSTRRTLAATALAPLLLTGFTACGGSGASDHKASDETATQVSALTGLEKGDQVDPADFVDTVADGVKESTTAHITMDVGVGPQLSTSGEGDIDYTTSPPSMQMTMALPGAGDAELIVADGIFYIQMGDLSGGKYWKIDPDDADGMLAGMGNMLDQADPIGGLKSLESGIETVTFEGNEDVDGRDLDHYELTVDLQAVLEEMGTELPREAAKGVPDSVTYGLWLDDEDRFAQLKMDYPVMDQQMTMEMAADDWGTDVEIEAPPADEVTEMPSMDDMLGDLGSTPSS